MTICIYGAGAVGSHLAAKLLRAGQTVAVVARGAHLAAMRDSGLTFRGTEETFTVPVPVATDDPASLPPQDFVVVTLKTVAHPEHAGRIAALLSPGGTAAFLCNGIPWWWTAGRPDAAPMPLLDPDAALWREVGPERTVAGVIYSPNELVAPGVVVHSARHRLVFGAPLPGSHDRAVALAGLMGQAGMGAEVAPDIRREVWRKLLLNAPGNPLCALTRLTAGQRFADPDLVELGIRIVAEVVAVAAADGCDLQAEVDLNALRATPAARWGTGRPSMLQDVLAGRPMEVESILGQTAAFARRLGIATPTIDVVLPLLRGLDRAVRGQE